MVDEDGKCQEHHLPVPAGRGEVRRQEGDPYDEGGDDAHSHVPALLVCAGETVRLERQNGAEEEQRYIQDEKRCQKKLLDPAAGLYVGDIFFGHEVAHFDRKFHFHNDKQNNLWSRHNKNRMVLFQYGRLG